MSSLTPLASYNLALLPFNPTQAIESDLPVTVHLTLAAIDPANAIDDEEQPSTLRILKSSVFNQIDDSDDEEDYSEDDEDAELNDDSDEDKIEEDEDDEEDDDEEEGDEDEDDEDIEIGDDEDDVEEYVVCTLSPKVQFQQTLDLTINPDEEVFFVVTGSYPIHLTGNYVEHPYDNEEDEFDSEDDSEDEYDLSPDEDEIYDGEDFDINDLEEESDVEGKIEELVDEEEAKKLEAPKETKKSKKDNKKRQVEEVEEEEEEEKPAPKETKKQKKAKKAAEEAAAKEEKNVKFNKELEQGPTESKKPKTQTLAGGVVIEDRVIGKGPQAKNGNRVGVRYIGKLQNGSTFDKNVSGKPFSLVLGRGEVIKGWEIGLQNLAVGGERRIIIPPKLAYGSQALPGIPKNSTLIFDVKLVSLK